LEFGALISEQSSMTASLSADNENGLSVKVTKPVSYIVKGLRLEDFENEQPNHWTIRASLPLPMDETFIY
jgi:hypothetical protein